MSSRAGATEIGSSSSVGPIILATWSFGVTACRAGWGFLPSDEAGASTEGRATEGGALDAVEAGARAVEADPQVDSVGWGGLPAADGKVTLDAAIMSGPDRVGAVAVVGNCVHAVTLARRVMTQTNHVMLAGSAAEAFAEAEGLATTKPLLTEKAAKVLAQWRKRAEEVTNDPRMRGWLPPRNVEECAGIDDGRSVVTADDTEGEEELHNRFHDTVGVLARAQDGTLAAACSTSGMAFKQPGRVGDSPIPGQGLYCEQGVGSAVATGNGELIMGVSGSFLAVEFLRQGYSADEAAQKVIERIVEVYGCGLAEQHQVAVVVLDQAGEWSAAALRPGYRTAVLTTGAAEPILVPAAFVAFTDRKQP